MKTIQVNRLIIVSAIIVGTSAIGFFVVYPAIKKSFIRKRLETAFNDPASVGAAGGLDKLLVTEAFDMNRFDDGNNKATISRLEARERAEQIWENYSSWLSSNQTAIISAFSNLGHIDDVSKIAHEFYYSYDEELLNVLKDALSDKAQYNLLIGKINKLPKN